MNRWGYVSAMILMLGPGAIAQEPPTADAKVAANVSMGAISTAMQLFYIDFNQLTTIENLDDVFATTATPNHQAINNGGGALVIDVGDSRVRRRVLTLDIGMVGPPYLTVPGAMEPAGGDYDEGTPLDPWGTPYYLYSPLGLVEPDSETISLRYYGDFFDSYTLVSHGPNGQYGGGDDLALELPFYVTRASVSSARLASAGTKGAAGLLTIRGYVLGNLPGSGAILVNGVDYPATIQTWTPTRIEALLAVLPPDGASIAVRTSAGTVTRSVALTLDGTVLSAESWNLYP